MIADGLITLLTQAANPLGGVHKDALPRGYTFPAMALHRYTGNQDYDMQGPTDTSEDNIQIDCYGTTQNERDALVASVMAALDAYVGTLSDGTVVQACYRERGPQDMPVMADADTKGVGYRSVIGYRIVKGKAA
jgi:hypothetical protein